MSGTTHKTPFRNAYDAYCAAHNNVDGFAVVDSEQIESARAALDDINQRAFDDEDYKSARLRYTETFSRLVVASVAAIRNFRELGAEYTIAIAAFMSVQKTLRELAERLDPARSPDAWKEENAEPEEPYFERASRAFSASRVLPELEDHSDHEL